MITPIRYIEPLKVDWDVSRCNRLLRPIVSRIATLRKLKDLKESRIAALKEQSPTNSLLSSEVTQKPKLRPRSFSSEAFQPKEKDPDWLSLSSGPLKKRKIGRQYSARSAVASKSESSNVAEGPCLQPGELTIPTPYTSKVAPPTVPTTAKEDEENKASTLGRPRIVVGDIVTQRFMSKAEEEPAVVQGLVKGFLDVMDATSTHVTKPVPSSLGSRSLFSSCLRRLPAWVQQEQARIVAEVEEHRDITEHDIADELYEFLVGTFELKLGQGVWIPLREIVRAQAVSLVKKAVSEGLISREDTRSLIRHLLNPQRRKNATPAPIEAEALMLQLVATETPLSASGNCCLKKSHLYAHSLNNIGIISKEMDAERRRDFELRGFKTLITSADIPVEWLATAKMTPLWSNALRSILDTAPASASFVDHASRFSVRDAFMFLQTAVAFGTGCTPSSTGAHKILAEIPAHFGQGSHCPRCPRPASGTFLARSSAQQHALSSKLATAKTQLSNAFTKTLSSLSTILASFVVASTLDSSQRVNVDVDSVSWILNSLSMDILLHGAQQFAGGTSSTISKCEAFRMSSILVSTLVCQLAGYRLKHGLVESNVNEIVDIVSLLDTTTVHNTSTQPGIVDSLPELICSILQGSSKIVGTSSLTTVQHLIRSLADPKAGGFTLTSSTRFFLRRLALSTALEYSHRQKTSESQALVREVEKNMSSAELSKTSRTPVRPSSKSRFVEAIPQGFRWEEGICEWVAATPHTKALALVDEQPEVVSWPVKRQIDVDEDLSDRGARAYMSPATTSGPLESSDEQILRPDTIHISDTMRLSDMLASSSPVHHPVANTTQSTGPSPRSRKRAWSFDNGVTSSPKRKRTVAATANDSTLEHDAKDFAPTKALHCSSSIASSPRPKRGGKPHMLKRTLSKRTLSKRVLFKSSSDDELTTSPLKATPKRAVARSTIARRRPASRLLRTLSAPTRPSKRPAAILSDDEDDELSFA
ncbi:hypothetical protein EJ08DRAFT_681944 [Tothia fuscella]|uniref:Uncharacterized protein n=1 Tax=Tothia fuscella TaxID=1048955 RepID=A0A9P4NJW0_9PEZI|nr:hypothetical protein EJ08DRAFT_681944 [Tothia fuscella]